MHSTLRMRGQADQNSNQQSEIQPVSRNEGGELLCYQNRNQATPQSTRKDRFDEAGRSRRVQSQQRDGRKDQQAWQSLRGQSVQKDIVRRLVIEIRISSRQFDGLKARELGWKSLGSISQPWTLSSHVQGIPPEEQAGASPHIFARPSHACPELGARRRVVKRDQRCQQAPGENQVNDAHARLQPDNEQPASNQQPHYCSASAA